MLCERYIQKTDVELLRSLPQAQEVTPGKRRNELIRKWLVFDTALRNELAKARAAHKHIDLEKYLRPQEEYLDSGLTQLAISSHRNPSILEAEKILDKVRWDALEELEAGHYFDLEKLIIYAYKLKLLRRWERINSADKGALIEEAVKNN